MSKTYPKQSQLIGKMVRSTTMFEVECEVCGDEFADEGGDGTKADFVRLLRSLGWTYGWDEENCVEGVICPDCLPPESE